MNTSKLLNICRYIFRYKPLQKITYVKNIKLPLKNTTKLLLYSIVAGVSIDEEENEIPDEIPNKKKTIDHQSLLTKHFSNMEMELTDAIKTLQNAVTETCEKYRSCLEDQMDVINTGANLDPSNKHWKKLRRLQKKAANLKNEFETYKKMVQQVGQTVNSIVLCSDLNNTEDANECICYQFSILEKNCIEETKKNKEFEKNLLEHEKHVDEKNLDNVD